jgi:hypothetical protein
VKSVFVTICSCVVLAGVAAQPIAARKTASASEATKVRAQLLYEVALFNQSRWRAAWRTYTPRIHSGCSYPRFVTGMKTIRATVGRVALRNVAVRVTGNRAFVTYRIVGHGKVVGGSTARNPDVFARIGGRWLDDVDADGLCP